MMMLEIAGGIVLGFSLLGILMAAIEGHLWWLPDLISDVFARVFAYCGLAVVVSILGYVSAMFVWGMAHDVLGVL